MAQAPQPLRIEIYDDFFEPPEWQALMRLTGDVKWRDGWKSSRDAPEYTQFNCDFTGTAAANREEAKDRIRAEYANALLTAWDAIQLRAIRAPHALLRCYANLSRYGIDGMPHRDTDKANAEDLTCLLYCVQGPWPLEWGGETVLCQGDEIVKSVMPRENRLLLFPSSMVHIARGVTRACFEQRIVLVWKSAPGEK
jgi:SM-20-related protein